MGGLSVTEIGILLFFVLMSVGSALFMNFQLGKRTDIPDQKKQMVFMMFGVGQMIVFAVLFIFFVTSNLL